MKREINSDIVKTTYSEMQYHPQHLIKCSTSVWFQCSALTSQFFVNTPTALYQETLRQIRFISSLFIITLD
jgi:hypothetical protein